MESHPEQASSSQPLHPGDARWSLVLRCQTIVDNLAPFHAVARACWKNVNMPNRRSFCPLDTSPMFKQALIPLSS